MTFFAPQRFRHPLASDESSTVGWPPAVADVRPAMSFLASTLVGSYTLNFAVVLLLVAIVHGVPAPSGNEYLYLLVPAKHATPEYLLNDWTLSQPWTTHYVFNAVIGPATRLMPLELVGWIGRLACWLLTTLALFRLGSRFQIPRAAIAFSVALWVLLGQAVVAGDWIYGGFEAKTVAYVLVLFALDAFLSERWILASALLGSAFSFHPQVGLWSALAVALTLLVMGRRLRTLLVVTFTTALFALPGVVPVLSLLGSTGAPSAEDWQFFALVRSPHHLDPFAWPRRDIVLAYLIMLFNWLQFRRSGDQPAIRFLTLLQLFFCLFFSLGLLSRFTDQYALLRLAPFRLFPVLVLVFFFFHLMAALYRRPPGGADALLVVVGLLAVMGLNNPVGLFLDAAQNTYAAWRAGDDDLRRTFKWIAGHTANGTTAILPPWRRDASYVSRRAHIADWNAVPVDRLSEWRERIAAMVGPNWVDRPEATWREKMEAGYNERTDEDIRSIVRRYGGDYLVSKARYPYDVLFDSGTYRVYSLARPSGGS